MEIRTTGKMCTTTSNASILFMSTCDCGNKLFLKNKSDFNCYPFLFMIRMCTVIRKVKTFIISSQPVRGHLAGYVLQRPIQRYGSRVQNEIVLYTNGAWFLHDVQINTTSIKCSKFLHIYILGWVCLVAHFLLHGQYQSPLYLIQFNNVRFLSSCIVCRISFQFLSSIERLRLPSVRCDDR